jgi:hypothetical protein
LCAYGCNLSVRPNDILEDVLAMLPIEFQALLPGKVDPLRYLVSGRNVYSRLSGLGPWSGCGAEGRIPGSNINRMVSPQSTAPKGSFI